MDIKRKSKRLSYLLRHHPEDINSSIDRYGWMNVSDLIKSGEYTLEDLEKLVDTGTRFGFNEDKTKIRAFHGHSVDGVVALTEYVPSSGTLLYHGTSIAVKDKLLDEGIRPMSRNYVHLSMDFRKAKQVGSRHGKPCVFEIDAEAMYNDGVKMFDSQDGVVLVEYVAPRYIKLSDCFFW